MKLKSILLTAVATIGLTAATMAQVPNYVPTNGLVGWWPFNGNANDESGNGINGTVIGAVLATDRFGSQNSAYSYNGSSNVINCGNSTNQNLTLNGDFTFSAWIKASCFGCNNYANMILSKHRFGSPNGYVFGFWNGGMINYAGTPNFDASTYPAGQSGYININVWKNVIVVYESASTSLKYYIDGNLVDNKLLGFNMASNIDDLVFGAQRNGAATGYLDYFSGKIDDIGIWNRALTQQEITDLYNAVNAVNCANNTTITPQTNSLATGSTANFTATTSDSNPSYIWQTDLGQGFQTLNNFGNYSGVNTAILNIANVQLPNHTQPIRVISTSGNCIDTSNVAVINILDTCITNVTIYDTLLTTVTDTLVINAVITGINPPNNLNTLKVFPNPASTHITIDYGNFNSMSGYTLNIVNFIGQTVFTTQINQQTSYIDLSTWTGNGIYFVQLIDPQNNTIENRKIVIQ